jgi:hypothetical protein
MILNVDMPALLQEKYLHLKARLVKLDQILLERYGHRYAEIKQKINATQDWYRKAQFDARNSGTIPLEQKQKETDRQFAQAGSEAARQEQVLKQQLKKLWRK